MVDESTVSSGYASVKTLLVVEQLRRKIPGGIGTYARAILESLAKVDIGAGAELELFASRYGEAGPDPLTEYGFPLRTSKLPHPLAQRAWDRGLDLPKLAMGEVVHSFSMGGPRLRTKSNRSIFTIYDTAWIEVPETFPKRGRTWHASAFDHIRKSGSHVVTISERSHASLVRAGIEPDRLTLIPPGSDHLSVADKGATERLLSELGVGASFILSVSTLEPRKNLQRLVEGFRRFKALNAEPIDLVVVGPKGWDDSRIDPIADVHMAGLVSSSVLAGLLTKAASLVYVPLYEGFGLPVLEANVSCVPVVASDIPASEGCALIVDPLDPDSIAYGIERSIFDTRLRSDLVTCGLMRANEMTWSRSAKGHLDLWKQLGAE
ncbi:MAG: glycosyltransferase family 4 protein [Acidimicrobiaceae bacterium]|nr:glycosyltransferase family 4 protein [Acidimicrobiaceae bacterium]